MKTLSSTLLAVSLLLGIPAIAATDRVEPIAETLKHEIIDLLTHRDFSFLDSSVAIITVEFLVNARSEVVILDICGRDEGACAFVRQQLDHRNIHYKEKKQLTPYALTIRLVREDA